MMHNRYCIIVPMFLLRSALQSSMEGMNLEGSGVLCKEGFLFCPHCI
jgi:hypothetical protein